MRTSYKALVALALFALAVVIALARDLPQLALEAYCPVQEPSPGPERVVYNPYGAVLQRLAVQSSFSIVQVGAYIGDSPTDPLFSFLQRSLDPARGEDRPDVKVVLIEPIREYFDLLQQNYAGLPGIVFENVAIAESEGTREMYRLDVDPTEYGFPEWLSQLSSLKKERMGELWDKYENYPTIKKFYLEHRVTEVVRCVTLQQLLDRHQLAELDLLQVDAEGYDFEILQTLDFSRTKPRFINYERVLLHENEAACREMLSAQGYLLMDWGEKDTLAIHVDPIQSLIHHSP